MAEDFEGLIIRKNDPRYETLKHGFNLRFPPDPKIEDHDPAGIIICSTVEDTQNALQFAIDQKMRPTVRSGGHCYEGFVSNNRGGVIIDVGLLTGFNEGPSFERGSAPTTAQLPTNKYKYQIMAGSQNWDAAVALYKKTGKCIPGGSCYSVGVGGHITGGGYGLLSRLHGLTVDWVTGVDVLVVKKDRDGTTDIVELVHATKTQHADLFQLCTGGGGGNVGIVTSFYFNDLPKAPQDVALVMVSFPWKNFLNEDTNRKGVTGKLGFRNFLQTYGKYFFDNSDKEENWGLFTLLAVNTAAHGSINLTIQYCDKTGMLADRKPLMEFWNRIQEFQPEKKVADVSGIINLANPPVYDNSDLPPIGTVVMDWLTATQSINDSGSNRRGKYKSSYMSKNFTDAEADALYEFLIKTGYVIKSKSLLKDDFQASLVQIDSYGGAVNHGRLVVDQEDHAKLKKQNPTEFIIEYEQTGVYQRRSNLKLQYQTYWHDPKKDDLHKNWIRDLYASVHKSVNTEKEETPIWGDHYEGCYINYPDIDMNDSAKPDTNHEHMTEAAGELYYGKVLFAKMKKAKAEWDKANIFHHSLSIPLR